MRFSVFAGLLSLAAAVAVAVPRAAAQEGEAIKPLQSWTGRVSVEQFKLAPKERYITDQKTLEKLWKDWKVKGDAPKVDFDKNLILFAASMSSGLGLNPMLDKKTGNLQMLVIATADITADYGYHIVLIPRAGIKTIEGKAIDKGKEKGKAK